MHGLREFALSPNNAPEDLGRLMNFGRYAGKIATAMKARNCSYIFLLGAWLLAPVSGRPHAQAQQPTDTPSERAAQTTEALRSPALKPTLADFGWLAGHWQGAWGPRSAQQTWTAPKAGVMLGTFQLVEGDKTLVLELFTLVENADGIKLYLRHFTPSLNAWEKSGATALDLQSADAKSIVFVNSGDGQPKQDVITRVDPDTYVSRSEIVPEQGDTRATEITYHRVLDGSSGKRPRAKSNGAH